MTEVANDGYRIGRQRIVQADKHDHAIHEGDERSLCDRYSARALLLHDQPFVPHADHTCDDCSQRLSQA